MLNKLGDAKHDRIRLVQDRIKCLTVVHTAMNLPVPYLLTGCGPVGFSSSTVLHAVSILKIF